VAYIAGLVIVGLFFLVLHYYTELKKSQKVLVTAVVLTLIISAIAFNKYQNIQRDSMLNIVLKFNQGSTIMCEDIEVNSKNFTLSIGTYTFIGKKDTKNYAKMIAVSSCN